jgi:tRNA 2-thiouridine synthesizing protein A
MIDAAPPSTFAATSTQPAATDLTPHAELDCRGLSCPLPILKTKKALAGLAAGQVLKVVSTDPGSVPDMAAFSQQTGHAILRRTEGAGTYTFWLRKG